MNEEKARNVETLWTAEFIGMSATNFFHLMAQYILIVGLPIYIMNEMKGGELEAGLAMTFFQIGAVSSRPFAGRLIDSLHKGRLLLGATLAFFAIMLAFCFAHTEEAIYTLRLLQGIEFALGTTAAATLAALVLPAAKKGTGIGYFALSTNLAMVVGPLTGLLIIRSFGMMALFVFLAASALFTLWLANRRKLPDEIVVPKEKKGRGFSLVERQALPAALIGGLMFFAYGGVLTFIPLYARTLGMEEDVSAFFAIFALIIVVTRPFIGRIFDQRGADYTVYPGLLLFFLGFLCFAAAESSAAFLASAAILGARHQRRPCSRDLGTRRREFRLCGALRHSVPCRPRPRRHLLHDLAQEGQENRIEKAVHKSKPSTYAQPFFLYDFPKFSSHRRSRALAHG